MYCSLVSRGVVGGICLVFAKYWYERREEKRELKAAYRNRTAESASGHTEHLQASPAAMDVCATPLMSNAATVAQTQAPSEGRADARAKVSESDDIYPAAAEAEALSGDATDTVAPDSRAPITAALAKQTRGSMRERLDDDQRVEEALASGDLPSIDTLLEDIADPVLRDRLLNRLVASYYRLRTDLKHRATFYRVAWLQIEEAPSILEGIKEIGRPRPDYVEAFKSMTIALEEDGCLDTAIAVCELASSLGLQDGTKTGFGGRITRLKRRQMRIGTVRPEKSIH